MVLRKRIMRIIFKCFVVLLPLVWAEWVELESLEQHSVQKPSKAWIKYQEERTKHQTKVAMKNITSVSKLTVINPYLNATVPQNEINGKIELPAADSKIPKILEEIKQPNSRSSINGFVHFLKILQGKLIRKGKSTIMDKINLLKYLKNRIIKNIGEYIIQ